MLHTLEAALVLFAELLLLALYSRWRQVLRRRVGARWVHQVAHGLLGCAAVCLLAASLTDHNPPVGAPVPVLPQKGAEVVPKPQEKKGIMPPVAREQDQDVAIMPRAVE